MGRSISSFRTVLAMEKEDWRPFIMLQTNG
jgi:hypothetical protein